MQDNTLFMMEYLHARKITDAVIESMGIHWGNHSVIGGCIVIPVTDEHGAVLFNKYRRDPRQGDIKPKYVYDKGGKTSIYNVSAIKNANTVLVTEGEMDTLVALSCNIPAVTSTGGALSFQKEWGELFANKDVVICFDNDDAGADGMVRALSAMPHARIMFIPETVGVKDISDYVARGGNLSELMRTAKHYGSIEEVHQDMKERESLWLPTRFHEAYIEANTPKVMPKSRGVREDLKDPIARAKAVPIDTLLPIIGGKTKCIWHNEKSPSLQYYKESNHVFCFGCRKHGDAIDVVRQMRDCSFIEAVKHLS